MADPNLYTDVNNPKDTRAPKNDGTSAEEQFNRKYEEENQNSSGGGLKGWIKRKLGPGSGNAPDGSGGSTKSPMAGRGRRSEDTNGLEGLKGNSTGLGVEDSGLGTAAPPARGDVMARDGGKGDGVIR